jgi:hypothetical protein
LRHADWLRFLIPVWRFFETAQATPQIQFRHCASDAAPGPWLPALNTPAPRLARVFFNPEANLVLAQYAVLDQLVQRLEAVSPVSLESVKQWYLFLVLRRVIEAQLSKAGCREYQIRISRGVGSAEEELLVTDVLTCESERPQA